MAIPKELENPVEKSGDGRFGDKFFGTLWPPKIEMYFEKVKFFSSPKEPTFQKMVRRNYEKNG